MTREVDGGLQTVTPEAAGDRHHRPAPERAALRVAAQHHEGEEEADRREDRRGARRRRRAAPQGAEDRRARRPQGRRQGRLASPSWSTSSRTKRACSDDADALASSPSTTTPRSRTRPTRRSPPPRRIGEPVHVLVAGTERRAVAEAAAQARRRREGAARRRRRLRARAGRAAGGADRRRSPAPTTRIVAPATTTGKNVMPRVAALLDVMQVSDIIKVVSPDTFERPIYAGNAIQTVQATDAKKVITVRTSPSRPPARAARPRSRTVAAADDPGLSTFKGEEIAQIGAAGADLGQDHHLRRPRARLGGELPKYIEPIADKLGAAMGASPRRGRRRLRARTTGRSARPARWWRRTSTSRSASRARSSIWPA